MASTALVHPRFVPRPIAGAVVDGVMAVVALGMSLALLAHGGIGDWSDGSALDLSGALLATCATAPLLAWRRSARGVFVATAALSTLTVGLGYGFGVPPAPTVALYLLATSRDEAHPWTRPATVTTLTLLTGYLAAAGFADGSFPGGELLHASLAWALAWFAGDRTRLAHEHIAALAERARRAEREAERDRRLAAAEERTRIARDIHDSAGHAISVIALQAGTARLRHAVDPARSLGALEAIERLARQTASEIDEIVGALRDDAGSSRGVEAPRGLASLETLVARHASAGLDVTLRRAGAPRPLGGPADQAAYRILQEALSNAARHGTGSAEVELAFRDTVIELTVVNPAATAPDAPAAGQHGLIGMRERAALLGGTVTTERVDGTFRARARLPYRGPAT